MDDGLILKNRLKEARGEKGLSQAALAALVGVSRNTISSIETLDKKFEDLFYF